MGTHARIVGARTNFNSLQDGQDYLLEKCSLGGDRTNFDNSSWRGQKCYSKKYLGFLDVEVCADECEGLPCVRCPRLEDYSLRVQTELEKGECF